MQNVDYSRKIRHITPHQPYRAPEPVIKKTNQGLSRGHIPQSGMVLLIGAVFIFTAGIFVGLRLEQKEDKFAEKEKLTVRNYSIDKAKELKKESPVNEVVDQKEESTEVKNNTLTTPSGIQYPPHKGTINYLIQVGVFSVSDANTVGKKLMTNNASLQGRIFRTASGKLYIGYYYNKKDAMDALSRIKNQGNSEASLRAVRF